MRPFIPRLVAFAMFATACQDSGAPTAPVPAPPLSERIGQGVGVSVMTRNLYIGFDADAAIAALATGDPTIFGPVLLASVTTLQNTDFHVRAQTIVDEIARTRPHAVGLQEVYRIHADLSALNLPITIDLDYLAILQAALAERHLPYVVAGSVVDSDLQPLPGIELVDREVLLVDASRARVGAGVVARTFQANIGVIAPGIDKKAGYIVAPITIGDLGVTLVTTHLESDLGPGSYPQLSQLRAAQAAEIIGVIGTAPRVVVLGDLNDVEGSLMYRALAQAGLVDTWRRLRRSGSLECGAALQQANRLHSRTRPRSGASPVDRLRATGRDSPVRAEAGAGRPDLAVGSRGRRGRARRRAR